MSGNESTHTGFGDDVCVCGCSAVAVVVVVTQSTGDFNVVVNIIVLKSVGAHVLSPFHCFCLTNCNPNK